ncbi:MAG: hypothetical protein QF391_02875, partial [Myxococcota bacterium]|nr:hypothetical protein [Myxococcota bacterium]
FEGLPPGGGRAWQTRSIWPYHYTRLMDSNFDIYHFPFVHRSLNPALGPVVVFSVRAEAASDFRANFTFVQGHVAYHPDPGDSQQLGILAGALGTLADGDHLLGYLVLPAKVDLSQPTDVYWNDRRISVALLR